MLYSEASYFDGYAFAHIAAYEEHKRLERKRRDAQKTIDFQKRHGTRTGRPTYSAPAMQYIRQSAAAAQQVQDIANALKKEMGFTQIGDELIAPVGTDFAEVEARVLAWMKGDKP